MPKHQDGGISVVIANWNGGDHIARCLDSLAGQSRTPDEIVVVDNGSTDGSPGLIRRNYPHVRLLTRPVNEGFCKGYNNAIRASRHPYLLILNNDVTLDPTFLQSAVDAVLEDDRIGWVSGTIAWAHSDDVPLRGRFLRRSVSLANGSGEDQDVFAGSGAAIFCRRRMLDDIAFQGEVYDETFFAYIEDLDLAWRARWRGWRCVYRSSLKCRHAGSASQSGRVRIPDKSVMFLVHILKNRYLTLVKNATPGLIVRFAPWFVLGELVLWLRIGTRSPRKLLAVPEAVRQFAALVVPALIRRRHIMRRRTASDRDILSVTRGV